MTEKKKEETKDLKEKELNTEDLQKISGGSIRDVKYKKTKDISKDTIKKI